MINVHSRLLTDNIHLSSLHLLTWSTSSYLLSHLLFLPFFLSFMYVAIVLCSPFFFVAFYSIYLSVLLLSLAFVFYPCDLCCLSPLESFFSFLYLFCPVSSPSLFSSLAVLPCWFFHSVVLLHAERKRERVTFINN